MIVNKTIKNKLSSALCNTVQKFRVGNIVKNITINIVEYYYNFKKNVFYHYLFIH